MLGYINMSIADLPPFYNMSYTDKEGNLTNEAQSYHDNSFQSLDWMLRLFNQLVISTFTSEEYQIQGFTVPSATTAEITVHRDNNDIPVGTIWLNSSLGSPKLQVKTALGSPGTIETIQSV